MVGKVLMRVEEMVVESSIVCLSEVGGESEAELSPMHMSTSPLTPRLLGTPLPPAFTQYGNLLRLYC